MSDIHTHTNIYAIFHQSRGNRYALNIRNVTVADLGNYTCQASNQLGKDREALTVSGIPSICEIVESVSLCYPGSPHTANTIVHYFPLLTRLKCVDATSSSSYARTRSALRWAHIALAYVAF